MHRFSYGLCLSLLICRLLRFSAGQRINPLVYVYHPCVQTSLGIHRTFVLWSPTDLGNAAGDSCHSRASGNSGPSLRFETPQDSKSQGQTRSPGFTQQCGNPWKNPENKEVNFGWAVCHLPTLGYLLPIAFPWLLLGLLSSVSWTFCDRRVRGAVVSYWAESRLSRWI